MTPTTLCTAQLSSCFPSTSQASTAAYRHANSIIQTAPYGRQRKKSQSSAGMTWLASLFCLRLLLVLSLWCVSSAQSNHDMHALNGNTTTATAYTSWSFGPQPALTMLHSVQAADHVSESHVRLTCNVLACQELPQAHHLLVMAKSVMDSSRFPILIHSSALHQRMLALKQNCLVPATGLIAVLGGRFCITSNTPHTEGMRAELARLDSPVNQTPLSPSFPDAHLHLCSTTSCFLQIHELAQALPYAPFWRVPPTVPTP